MRTSAKLGLTALLAALLLSSAISTASARNLSVNRVDIRVTWASLELEGGLGVKIRCRFTMEGSFHRRTIPKVLGSLIGIITRATPDGANCTNATVTTSGLPWHLSYEGFIGRLPNIEGILVLLREYRFTDGRILGGPDCTYGTATDRLLGTANISSGTVTNIIPQVGNRSNLVERRNEGIIRCPAQAEFLNGSASEGQVTLLNSSNRVVITLI